MFDDLLFFLFVGLTPWLFGGLVEVFFRFEGMFVFVLEFQSQKVSHYFKKSLSYPCTGMLCALF